jgi:acetaldehyde dehydrogenase/alcohol dehydrogenase
MIEIGGKGHSAAIHSENNDSILAWSALDVCRIGVNGPAVLVSAGLASGLNPAATIGTGFYGSSSIGDNIGPMHLIQWAKVAYAEEIPQGLSDSLTRWETNQVA